MCLRYTGRVLPAAVAAVAWLFPSMAAAEKILTVGDSITFGDDDERVPDDRCGAGPVTGFNRWSGFRGILECRLGANGENGFEWSHFAAGGQTTEWGAARIDQAIATLSDGDTALVSLHVNDCSPGGCGRVCDGGTRDTLPCIDNSDCPGAGAFCDTSGAHECSSADSRAHIQVMIDALLDAGYTRVIFWKSAGHVGALESGANCYSQQFDGTADAIDTLFLTDPYPVGYADDPRVEFAEETFQDSCVGTGLQGCGPEDELGDRRTWWFAKDTESKANGEGSAHVHPNAWGYMELAARLGERIAGGPLNTRPPTPSVSVIARSPTTITIRAEPVVDPDGDPVAIYAWASCADTGGDSSDFACDTGSASQAPFLPRECGAVSGADHDGWGVADEPNPGYLERHLVVASEGVATLTGLDMGTDYRICVVAYDGFQGSFFNDLIVFAPGAVPAFSRGGRLILIGLLALGAGFTLSWSRPRGGSAPEPLSG
jgi:hypothetical protein